MKGVFWILKLKFFLKFLTASPDEFVVTWVTLNQTATPSMVKFGLVNTGERMATGTVTAFTDGGPLKMVRYVHRVRLTSLLPDSVYGKWTSLFDEFLMI